MVIAAMVGVTVKVAMHSSGDCSYGVGDCKGGESEGKFSNVNNVWRQIKDRGLS